MKGVKSVKARSQALLKRIATSRASIAKAEAHLAKVVAEVRTAARAEKITISNVVAEALKELNAAKSALEALEKLATEK